MINSEIAVWSMNFNGLENIGLKCIKHKLSEVWVEMDRNSIIVEDSGILVSTHVRSRRQT